MYYLFDVANPNGRAVWGVGLQSLVCWEWVWVPPGAWISVSCECCVLSDEGLCVGPITCPEEFYRV